MMSFRALFFCRKESGVFRGRSAAPLLMFFTFLILTVPFIIPAAAGAAEVNYNGDGDDLQASPSWLPKGTHQAVLPDEDGVFLSSDNVVTVNYDANDTEATNPHYVIGGLSESEDVTGNTVTFIDGKAEGSVYGGVSNNGNAEQNTVAVDGGEVDQNIFGGYSASGNAVNNSVVMTGGKISMSVFGGYSYGKGGDASYNTVVIRGGEVGSSVYGGVIDANTGSGNAEYNTVVISGGSVADSVYGGWSTVGSASNNTVTISGGYLAQDVYGGFSSQGNLLGKAAYNTVDMSDGIVNGGIVGGHLDTGVVEYNTVIVSGGKVGEVYGGFSWYSANIINNLVTINGGSVSEDVYGGYCNDKGDVTNNAVTVNGGSVSGDIYGGGSINGSAEYNAVTISGGEIGANVYGGYVGKNGEATGNTVAINGGYFDGNVYGGYVNGNGAAINNTVTIDGNPIFSENTYLYGGYVAGNYGENGNFSGNTLNVKSAGVTVAGVDNFEYYNFYLPQGMSENYTMLTVTDDVNLNDTAINIYLQGDIALEEGATVTLIKGGENPIIGTRDYGTSQASHGAFITHDFYLYTDDVTNSLVAELTSTTYSADNKVLTNSRLAALAFLNQGADMAASLEHFETSGDERFTTFAAAGGGSSTYATGSDVDIDSFSMLAGVTWNAPVKRNRLTLSAFIDAGWSSYDTTNNFGDSKDIKGKGKSDYFGGGLHMRYTWDSGVRGGLYAEGSFRYGRVTTNFDTNDLQTEPAFHYDSGSNYYGVHAGLGYVWQLSGRTRLDVSGKYLWTHLESDEFTASSGDRVRFSSADSRRLRAGFRIYHDYGNANAVTLYYGAAYEYEFDGDAAGRLYGAYALDGSSLSGGSGIGELGVTFRPSRDNDRLTMQLGVQGYVGVREGVSGTLKLQYAF